MKTFRPYNPTQSQLLPQSPLDWLPPEHLAFFILDVVGELNLREIFQHYERDHRGAPPYHPQMMVSLILYGYCVGICSSRAIERKTHEDVAFRVIAAGQHPDHVRISEFRRIHLRALEGLFQQVLKLCQKAGLVKLGHVALDGTKMKANASKHKAMSYDRMKEQEAALRKKVRELLAEAEAVDEEEDRKFGKGRRGDELPEDLRHAQSRLAKIRAAKKELEEEARAQQKQKDDDGKPGGGSSSDDLPTHQIPTDEDGKPTSKAQRNFTDPESRIQKGADGFVQGYNCQAAVDDKAQVIVAQAVTNQPPDVEHLPPMLAQIKRNCGQVPRNLTADAGYFSEENIAVATQMGVDIYMATQRWKHRERPAPPRGRAPTGLTAKELMTRKVTTKKGMALYARRKTTVEPVFGQIKEARGFRRFLMRGIAKVRGEWSLLCTTHNLLKLHACWAA